MTQKENSKESVLKYLKTQNRPYSANDIMMNLHKEFGKTAVQKALDDLTSENKVREKVYGKQKVYAVVQEDDNDSTDVDIVTLDSKIEDVTERLKTIEQELKKNEAELKELKSLPTTETALKEKTELMETINEVSEKIETLSNSTVKISEEEKKKLHNDHEKLTKECRKRKRICMDIVNQILENYPKKLKVLMEEIGIETDEDVIR